MAKVVRLVAGLFVGAAVGATIVLLLAPSSGEEVRRVVRDRLRSVAEEGRRAGQARTRELREQLEALTHPS